MTDRGRRADDRGAVLVVASLVLTGLMVLAALVVDIGHMRGMRRANQSIVDLAALAAGDALGSSFGPDAQEACEDAERYLRLNASSLSALDLDCSTLPSTCGPTTPPATVTKTTGPYDVTITYPVADTDIADSDVAAANQLRTYDGDPCDRMKVAVRQTGSTYFSGIVGWDELSSSASAVVRQIPARDRRVPSLWLLDPYGCDVLTVQGGSNVTVGAPGVGGLVSVDSDGSACTGNSFTVDVGGSGSRLQAIPADTDPPGAISLVAIAPGQVDCSDGNPYACDPSDVANGTLSPQPTRRGLRATRAPVDHRYNCRSGEGAYPDYHGIEIDDCDGSDAPYIDQLRTAVGTTGTPAGFNRWSDKWGCSSPATPPGGIDGNWVVDCADFRVGSGTDVIFNGGNVIFDGDITMTGGSLQLNAANTTANLPAACLDAVTGCVSQSSAEAAWVYMRGGDLRMTGGALLAHHTTVYQHDGYFSIAGGSPPVWSAPTEGPFTSLAVWSELASNRFQINGGASMELTGIFFTPEADPFSLSGGSPLLPQQAQFISYRAAISGGAVLTLAPLDTQPLYIPPPEPLLIR